MPFSRFSEQRALLDAERIPRPFLLTVARAILAGLAARPARDRRRRLANRCGVLVAIRCLERLLLEL